MSYDDIVIGSGLAALGVVLGLPADRRVLVLGGPLRGQLSHYDAGRAPTAYLGFGGLGRYWHGVIPTGLNPDPDDVAPADFAALFRYFYPRTDVAMRIGDPWLFVPRRPIRTPAAWATLAAARGGRLQIRHALADCFRADAGGVTVRAEGDTLSGARLWIAAGTLHTPRLLRASLQGFDGIRPVVSDHVIAYMGQIDRKRHPEVAAPRVERAADGFWVPATFNPGGQGLFTLKPARFAYRHLDHGIEQRAAFGLPTGGVIGKLIRAASAGLVAEALYNKLGLFPDSDRLSAYAQILVRDGYEFDPAPALTPRPEVIRAATDAVRHDPAWADVLTPSRRPELFVNGIHLHHSIAPEAVRQRGINVAGALITIVDASIVEDIGAEHHSFKIMAAAYAKARQS